MKQNLSDIGLTFSKNISSTFDKSSSSRIKYQDLYETIGILKSQSHKQFPSTIRELKEMKFEKKRVPELGIPVDRRDAQSLIRWLDSMLNKVSEANENLEGVLESAMSIYEVCFNEIVRQVSVHCKERGELISRVWKAYISLLERALRISQASQQAQILHFRQEKENIKASTATEVFKLRCDIEEKSLDILGYADKLAGKEDEISKMGTINKRLLHRLEIIRNHYEGVKKEIVGLREENRILKAKLINTETEFIVNDHGVIEAQHKRLKIKRKSKGKLEKLITSDPIIISGNKIDLATQENLSNDIDSYENQLEEIFKQVDFQDNGNDALVITVDSKEIQTELDDLCGESFGENRDRVDPTPAVLDLIDKQLNSLIRPPAEGGGRDFRRQSSRKEVSDIFKNSANTEKVNVFIERMKENLGVVSNPLINSLYKSVSTVLKDIKAEARPETKRLKTIRHKIWGVIQESRLKKNSEITALIVQKIKNTPQHKLKKILVKKILLKFITQFYESKQQKRSIDLEGSKKQELSQHVLEVLSNKYGPGKIAESKFAQISSTCIKYKHIKRVKLFGRFLKLFDEFDNEDLETFLDFQSFLKNSTNKEYINAEYSDQFLISYEKAIDLFKSQLLQKISDSERKSIKLWIESNKFTDSLYRSQVIDQDTYLEFILEINHSKKYAKVNFLRCIYEAADVMFMQLNDDGYLQKVEFELLARHMAVGDLAEGFTTEVFNEFAETFTDEDEVAVQALSFENFAMMSGTYDIFSIESMQSFSKVTHSQGAIWHIKQVAPHINNILGEIRWRLSKRPNWKDYMNEYDLVLTVIKNKVINQKNPESVWIALRLLQEESKHICIESALRSFLPCVDSLVITSTSVL